MSPLQKANVLLMVCMNTLLLLFLGLCSRKYLKEFLLHVRYYNAVRGGVRHASKGEPLCELLVVKKALLAVVDGT